MEKQNEGSIGSNFADNLIDSLSYLLNKRCNDSNVNTTVTKLRNIKKFNKITEDEVLFLRKIITELKYSCGIVLQNEEEKLT